MITSERLAIAIASVLVALGLYNGANVLTDHLNTESFPEHARFHAALGGAYMILLSLVAAAMAWIAPLRKIAGGWPLSAVLLVLPLGFLGAVAVVPSGSPGTSYVGLALVGLVMAIAATYLLVRSQRA